MMHLMLWNPGYTVRMNRGTGEGGVFSVLHHLGIHPTHYRTGCHDDRNTLVPENSLDVVRVWSGSVSTNILLGLCRQQCYCDGRERVPSRVELPVCPTGHPNQPSPHTTFAFLPHHVVRSHVHCISSHLLCSRGNQPQ